MYALSEYTRTAKWNLFVNLYMDRLNIYVSLVILTKQHGVLCLGVSSETKRCFENPGLSDLFQF